MGLIADSRVEYKCPIGQEMVGGECFTPYVEYCDARKIDVRTGKPLKEN